MAKNNNQNKGVSGPFDFNGDGKTTPDEEAFGLMLTEQCRKNNNSSNNKPLKKTQKSKISQKIKSIPEKVDESNYDLLLKNYRDECFGSIIAIILLLTPAFLILWALYSTYDPDNSASVILTITFTIIGFVYCGFVLSITVKNISNSIKNIKLVKQKQKKKK